MFFHHTSPSPPPLPSSFIRPSYRSDKKKQSSIAFKATSATSRIAVGFKRFSRIFSKDSKSLPSASYKVSGRVLVDQDIQTDHVVVWMDYEPYTIRSPYTAPTSTIDIRRAPANVDSKITEFEPPFFRMNDGAASSASSSSSLPLAIPGPTKFANTSLAKVKSLYVDKSTADLEGKVIARKQLHIAPIESSDIVALNELPPLSDSLPLNETAPSTSQPVAKSQPIRLTAVAPAPAPAPSLIRSPSSSVSSGPTRLFPTPSEIGTDATSLTTKPSEISPSSKVEVPLVSEEVAPESNAAPEAEIEVESFIEGCDVPIPPSVISHDNEEEAFVLVDVPEPSTPQKTSEEIAILVAPPSTTPQPPTSTSLGLPPYLFVICKRNAEPFLINPVSTLTVELHALLDPSQPLPEMCIMTPVPERTIVEFVYAVCRLKRDRTYFLHMDIRRWESYIPSFSSILGGGLSLVDGSISLVELAFCIWAGLGTHMRNRILFHLLLMAGRPLGWACRKYQLVNAVMLILVGVVVGLAFISGLSLYLQSPSLAAFGLSVYNWVMPLLLV